MSRAAEWLKKRRQRAKQYDIHLVVVSNELGVLKAALQTYAGTAAKKEKAIADDLFGLIEYQENKQNKEN